MAKREIQKASIDSFEVSANTLARQYVRQIEAYCTQQKFADPETGVERDPNENFMRSLERSIGIQDYDKDAFRRALYERLSPPVQQGKAITYTLDGRLQAAIEAELLPNVRDVRRVLAPADSHTAEESARREELINRLVRERGYCREGAMRLAEYVGQTLSRTRQERGRGLPSLRWLWG